MNVAQTLDRPAPAGPREVAMTEAARLITSLMRCILWLVGHGVHVTGFCGRRCTGQAIVVVTVACSSSLHRIMPDAAWRRRRQEGELTIYTWFSVRFGIRVEWEEVCA